MNYEDALKSAKLLRNQLADGRSEAQKTKINELLTAYKEWASFMPNSDPDLAPEYFAIASERESIAAVETLFDSSQKNILEEIDSLIKKKFCGLERNEVLALELDQIFGNPQARSSAEWWWRLDSITGSN